MQTYPLPGAFTIIFTIRCTQRYMHTRRKRLSINKAGAIRICYQVSYFGAAVVIKHIVLVVPVHGLRIVFQHRNKAPALRAVQYQHLLCYTPACAHIFRHEEIKVHDLQKIGHDTCKELNLKILPKATERSIVINNIADYTRLVAVYHTQCSVPEGLPFFVAHTTGNQADAHSLAACR